PNSNQQEHTPSKQSLGGGFSLPSIKVPSPPTGTLGAPGSCPAVGPMGHRIGQLLPVWRVRRKRNDSPANTNLSYKYFTQFIIVSGDSSRQTSESRFTTCPTEYRI